MYLFCLGTADFADAVAVTTAVAADVFAASELWTGFFLLRFEAFFGNKTIEALANCVKTVCAHANLAKKAR